jgi:hypothetical protein
MTTPRAFKTDFEKPALEQLHREDDAIGQRIDWSLIFHAILMEAFFAAEGRSRLPVGAFGLTVAWIWVVTGVRQLWNQRAIVDDLEGVRDPVDHDVAYRQYLAKQRHGASQRGFRWAVAVPLFTIVVPSCCLVTWIFILLLIKDVPLLWRLVLVVAILGTVTTFSAYLWKRVRLPTAEERNNAP